MNADDLHLRTLTSDDFDQLIELDEMVFHEGPTAEEVKPLWADLQDLDAGRGTGVFDGDELVGVGTVNGFKMSVPGGLLPLAGVLFIGVKPTHTRRGVMSRVIRHQLHTLHEQGLEPLAGLTASESVIYGRFGYGVATYGGTLTVPRHRARLRPVRGAADVRIRMVSTADTLELCEAIHARQVGTRAGMLVRPPSWARLYAADPEQWRVGRSVLRTVLAERNGQAIGFARYRTRNDEKAGYTQVQQLHADDVAGYAALAGYLLNLDLTTGTKFRQQPLDSPLVYLLEDFRSAEMQMLDVLYLRLVDVDRALAARTYAAPVNVVLEVSDGLCPWNAGRWRLAGDGKAATCTRTEDAADLALDVRELASVYLGGATLAALAGAGLVTELRPGAVTDASRAFSTDLAPWLQFGI